MIEIDLCRVLLSQRIGNLGTQKEEMMFRLAAYRKLLVLSLCIVITITTVLYNSSQKVKTAVTYNVVNIKFRGLRKSTLEPRPDFMCKRSRFLSGSTVEDILCMKPINFLQNFKNPCWYEFDDKQQLKCLPYFQIIGSPKCGTTDLFKRLVQHPQIISNKGLFSKETWYWSWRRYGRWPRENASKYMTLNDFTSFFKTDEIAVMKINSDDGTQYCNKITGIGDPMDFSGMASWKKINQNNPAAPGPLYTTPHLIKHVLPNIKLILMLREPVERLYSHYLHGNYGKSPDEFHVDVLDSIKYFNECKQLNGVRACAYNESTIKKLKTPLTVSMYNVHLKEWLNVFPRDQIFILRSEDYYNDEKKYIRDIFKFLDVDDVTVKDMTSLLQIPKQYETVKKKKIGPMHSKTREILWKFYSENNIKIAAMLKDERYLWKDGHTHRRRFKGLRRTNQTRALVGDRIVVVRKMKHRNNMTGQDVINKTKNDKI